MPTVPTELPPALEVDRSSSYDMMSDVLQTIRSFHRFSFMLCIVTLALVFLATLLILYRWDKKTPLHGDG